MKTQNVNDVEAVTDVKISFSACEEHANNFGALNMKNENSNANNLNVAKGVYRKEYTSDDDIREFELVVYGELDENLNMKYSNQERAKLFEDHLPLPDYLNLVSFFLRQSLVSMSSYTESKKIRISLLRAVRGLFGRN